MTISTAARNAAIAAIAALVTGGSLELRSSGGTAITTLALETPAFGSPTVGVVSMAGLPALTTEVVTGGTVASAVLKGSTGNVVCTMSASLTAGTGEFKMSSLTLAVGEQVNVKTATLTQPAS
jgi:hypothetical protein